MSKSTKQDEVCKELSEEGLSEVQGGLTLVPLRSYTLRGIFAGPNDKTVTESPTLANLTSIRTLLTFR